MKNRTSGRFSCSQRCTGLKPSKMGAHTGSLCLCLSSANPIVGVRDEPIPPTILAIPTILESPARGAASEIQLLVERDPVLAAVGLVVVHEPPDVGGLDEIALVVVPLQRSLEPAEELHAFRIVGNQGVREAGCFVDECSGGCHPVVLEIAHATLEAD